MRIVIDIPDDLYKDCRDFKDLSNTTIYEAIRNGTPLSESLENQGVVTGKNFFEKFFKKVLTR